jgi:hypothetical protein
MASTALIWIMQLQKLFCMVAAAFGNVAAHPVQAFLSLLDGHKEGQVGAIPVCALGRGCLCFLVWLLL